MHYSGIRVRSLPSSFAICSTQLGELSGVEVYYHDPDSCSLIAVLEAGSLSEQESILRSIQALPSVATAELVYHHFEEATDLGEDTPS